MVGNRPPALQDNQMIDVTVEARANVTVQRLKGDGRCL